MGTTNNKATCPQCGAEGTAGRFCEYCGTKLPEPIPVATDNGTSFFFWDDVIKGPWRRLDNNYLDRQNRYNRVIGDYYGSLFMIVKSSLNNKKRIINRDGIFVTDDCDDIYIYTDNYDCVLVKGVYSLFKSVIKNLSTGKTIETFDSKLQHYKRFLIGTGKNVIIYNRLERQIIKLDKTIPEGFEFQRSDDEEDLVVFRCDQRVCKVKISGNQGYVTFIEPQVLVSAPKVEMPKEAVAPQKVVPQEQKKNTNSSLWITLFVISEILAFFSVMQPEGTLPEFVATVLVLYLLFGVILFCFCFGKWMQ